MRQILQQLPLLVGLLMGCAQGSSDWVAATPPAAPGGTPVHIVGVVRHSDLEGGFFAITGQDGTTYDPTNLPAEFQKDGLAVEAEARRRDDMAGIHMAGPIVDLVRIRRR